MTDIISSSGVSYDPLLFRPIPGHRQYVINNDGTVIKRIASDDPIRREQLKISPQVIHGIPTGYLYASLLSKDAINDQGEIYDSTRLTWRIGVHRLVGFAWVPNDDPVNKIWVNHLDGIKSNNAHTNLEWTTISEGIQHAYDTGLHKPPPGMRGKTHACATRQLMSAAKLGELHPKFKGWYITPLGRFATSYIAATTHNTYSAFIIRKCARGKDGWGFEVKQPSLALPNTLVL